MTGLGRDMLKSDNTARLAGMRPVSLLGNFPLLKSLTGQWSGILVNTGFGFYGYGMTWKSAEIIADLALHGRPLDDEWRDAVEYTSGDCPLWMPTCWPDRMYMMMTVSIAAVVFIVLAG